MGTYFKTNEKGKKSKDGKKLGIYWFKKVWKKEKFEESLGTKNKKLADQRYYNEILPQILSGTYKKQEVTMPGQQDIPEAPNALGIREVIEKYMNEISPAQKGHYRNLEIAPHWYQYLGDCLVSEVTKSKLSQYKNGRINGNIRFVKGKMEIGQGKGKRAGKSTVKKELSFLRMVFNRAIDDWDGEEDWGGYFKSHDSNPVKKVIKGLKDVERTRYIKPKEAKKLADSLAKSKMRYLTDMVVIGCNTGLREDKIVNLKEDHCDFDNGRINFPAEEMKNDKALSCKMTAEVKSTLLRVIQEKQFRSDFIFLDENGQPYSGNAVSMAFHRACKRAGIKNLRFHDLRHDFASLLINNGATLYQVAHALGQKDLRMAARYSHLFEENRDVAKYIEGKGTAAILRHSAEEGDAKGATDSVTS
ncbi:MAG: site-specific integrase [Thermodesulfovibrionales bacterium]